MNGHNFYVMLLHMFHKMLIFNIDVFCVRSKFLLSSQFECSIDIFKYLTVFFGLAEPHEDSRFAELISQTKQHLDSVFDYLVSFSFIG